MSARFFAKKKVVPFPGNHFDNAKTAVKTLQNDIEIADAQRFKNSVAALINSKTPAHRPSLGLFAAPKPKPKSNILELKNKTIFGI